MDNFDNILNNAPDEGLNGQPGRMAGNSVSEGADGSAAPGSAGQRLSAEEYAAKKKTEREAIYELSDNTAMEVAADSGRFRQYLDVQANFSRYSAVNALLILAQKPEATKLGDFDYWKNQNAYVGKGQTGISILEPGREYRREDGSVGVSYNIKKVFDVSQVDARKMKQAPVVARDERQILKALISQAPMKITGADELPDGLGARTDPDTGEIQVLKGMSFADTFRSLAHELCLAEADEAIGEGEVVDPRFTAYCASYVLCRKNGVDTKDYQFDSAGEIFGGMDAQAVKRELSQIRDAADAVSGRMARQLGAVTKAVKSREEAR